MKSAPGQIAGADPAFLAGNGGYGHPSPSIRAPGGSMKQSPGQRPKSASLGGFIAEHRATGWELFSGSSFARKST